MNPPEVTLEKGLEHAGMEGMFWAWHLAARNGSFGARALVTLYLRGPIEGKIGHHDIMAFTLINAWPKAVTVTDANAGASEMVKFTLTLVCDEIYGGAAPVLPDLLNWENVGPQALMA